jgi:hypothetical protein
MTRACRLALSSSKVIFPIAIFYQLPLLRRCVSSRKVPGSIPGRVSEYFLRGIRQVRVPGVDSAFRNEYQGIRGGKERRCVRLTTLPP